MLPNPDDTSTLQGAVDQTAPETPEALKDENSPVVTTPALQTPFLPQGSDPYHSFPMFSKVSTSHSFANSNIIGNVEEGLLIDFGDTPLVDPTTVAAQPILRHPNKLDLLFDDLEIPKLLPCPVTLPSSPRASFATISPDARMSSTVRLSTPIPSQTPHSSFTPSLNLATTEATSSSIYRPRTRAERATEPHTSSKPNWALAPTIQRPIFTKEPRPMHFNSNPPLPVYILPPSQPTSGLNLVTDRPTSMNDRPPAPLEKPMPATPHEDTGTPTSESPVPSVHPSRMQLLQSSGASSEAGFGPGETATKGTRNKQITGANTVPVARMRKWGGGATEDAGAETSAPGNVEGKGDIGSRISWVDRDPPPHPSATLDAVPMGSKIVASARIPLQATFLPTPTKRQTYSVTVESEDEGNASSPGQNTDGRTKDISIPAPSAPSLVRPSALKKRTVVEHPYEQTNPFVDPESTQESVSIAKTRVPLLQRMGIGSKVGPSALAAHRKLFIEEDSSTYDYDYQCENDEAYSEYEEEEYWTLPRARAENVVIAEPVGREERVEHTTPIGTLAKRVVRIAEPGALSQVQTRRRRLVHYQEGEQDEEGEYGAVYGQYPEEELRIGAAASRRFLVSQAEHNPAPRVSAPVQQGSPRHVIGSRARRVVIQAPPEVDDVDGAVERFRGLSVAGRVQTPGPRRRRVVKVHAQRFETTPSDQYVRR